MIFGKRDELLIEAKTRIAEHPASITKIAFTARPKAEARRSSIFRTCLRKSRPAESAGPSPFPQKYLKWQKRVYSYLAVPAVLYASMVGVINGNWKKHQEHMKEDERENRIEGATMTSTVGNETFLYSTCRCWTKPFKLIVRSGRAGASDS